ncbi:HEAT repeat-containing protein 6 isoform X1 [Alosa alosa]|uniref:HEAT repeat-containing protein 6 isoform X1 n=1 Tax=Alosa alosa TaxID=278164 RepID=UPI00201553FA|nr:HEAT repeat-containing protein 6 isoform X1 [Alosa alosa]
MEHGSSADMLLRCYYDKLCSLTPLDCPSFKTELNLLLDELISENYSNNVTRDNIRSEDVCRLLLKASQLVPFSQEHLVLKLCQLVSQLFNQLQVSMDTQTLHCLVSYYIQALQTCSLWTHADILLALSSLLCGNGSSCQQHLSDLLGQKGILVICSAPNQADIELRSAAIHCMANLCLGTPGQPYLEEPYREICFRTFLQTLQSPKPPGAEDLVFCTLLQNSLKGMQCLLNGVKWKPGHGDDLGFLLAVLKKLMFYGLPGMVVEMPKILYPAPLPQYDVPFPKVSEETMPTKPGGNKKKKPRGNVQKAHIEGKWVLKEDSGEDQQELELRQGGGRNPKQMIGNWSQKPSHYQLSWRSSESEYSDTEGGINAKLRLYQMRVRQGSLHCFLSLVKCVDKRVLFGYWSAFIPDTPAIGGPPSLTFLTVVLKDPSPKVRAGSLQVLSSLLEGSRLFLSAAEDTSTPRQAFTSFSATLASSLRELHRSLLLALMAESSSQTLTQVIKCVAHLVCNTPYHRLRPGLLSPIWKQIQQYVHHRDVNVRVSSLTLLGALVSAQAPLPEIQQLLQQPAKTSGDVGFPHEAHMCQNWRQQRSLEEGHWLYGEEGICWLLRLCVCVVTQPREDNSDSGTIPFHLSPNLLEPSPVRLEALQVLAHLVKGYFFLTQEWLLELCQVSACCLREQDSSVQLHGTKLLEELGTSIIQQYRTEEKIQESTKHVPLCKVIQFWSEVLSGPLTTALQNEKHPTLQTSACDTLSSILPQAFRKLPEKTQMLCVTMLLGLTYSENSLVKAASVRALGVYVLFPGLSEDVMFMMDSASVILTALEDHSPNVRAKAAWSLGNLTDAIIVNRENVVIDFQKELTSGLLFKLVKSSIQAAKDKDRVKSNAVRALGNLLHLLQPQQLKQPGFEELLEQAMCVLVDTVQSDATMKVRWNACYALGNAFKNPALPLGTASWSAEAYSALSCVVVSCKNFKVRIKSAAALSIPSSRAKYGSSCQFAQIWIAITKALENSKDGVDFVEYRYHTSLCAQLCQTLLHLLNLCQPQDLGTIQSSVTGRFGSTLMGFLVNYLVDHESETEKEDKEERGKNSIQDRMNKMICVLGTLRKLSKEEEGCSAGADNIIDFLEGVVRSYKQTILQVSLSGHHSFQDQTNQTTEVSDAVQAKV